jgi:hypothetical protein
VEVAQNMNHFLVKTSSCIEYVFEAHRFEISNGIVHFYDNEGEVIWVIKEWISLRRYGKSDTEPKTPDEFYDQLNDGEKWK